MQTASVHFKQQIRQAKCTLVDNKCCVQLAIIGHPVTLDKVPEANDFGGGFLAEPDKILVARYLHLLVIFRPPPLLVIKRAFLALNIFDANILLQPKSKVDWLSKRSTILRSKSVNFLNFRARTILG
jgi:hypothetical protein